ncbi:MAG: hypothetical protein DRJ98_00025 [Thermoprotei archaeon]|nr:MAG: hypothetical protein DRJ98_00025 [Thermoprotei archaeon]
MNLEELTLDLFLLKPHPHVVKRLVEAAEKITLNPVKLKPPIFKPRQPPTPASIITGVDGGFQVKELCGGSLIIATGVAYTSSLSLIEDLEPVIEAEVRLADVDEPVAWAEALERRLTFKSASRAVIERKPEAVFIDGGLLLHPTFFASKGDCKIEVEGCLMELAKLLNLTEKIGINIAGIVKRPRGKLFDGIHRDAALLDLEEGEATEPRPAEEASVRRYAEAFRKVGVKLPVIMVSYVKTSSRREPLRVEYPSWCSFDEILATILATSDSVMGVPVHVVKADVHTKVHGGIVKAVYSRLLYRLLAEYGERAEDYLRPIRGESLEES